MQEYSLLVPKVKVNVSNLPVLRRQSKGVLLFTALQNEVAEVMQENSQAI